MEHNEESQNKNNLTLPEKEVLDALSKGNSLKQVARELQISYEGVRSHVKRIFKKLHAGS